MITKEIPNIYSQFDGQDVSTVKMIVSGFEVFGGLNKNPTLDILKDLKENPPPGVDLYTIALPVEYDACFEPLESLVDDFRPDSVIALGVAAGRSSVQPERIGINIEDTGGEGRMGDNRGNTPVDRKIRGTGQTAIFPHCQTEKSSRQYVNRVSRLIYPIPPVHSSVMQSCTD